LGSFRNNLPKPRSKEATRQAPDRARSRLGRRASAAINVAAFERRKPARRPLPDHLPHERIVYPLPAACPCCGGATLRKIGEDVTETLELIPRQWKVIPHVREKFSCRACEAITRVSGTRAISAYLPLNTSTRMLPIPRPRQAYAR
jgi:hypothetical protein